jgi:hypothetical protein
MQPPVRIGSFPTLSARASDAADLFASALDRAAATAPAAPASDAEVAAFAAVALPYSANGVAADAERLLAARVSVPDLPWDAPRG